MDNIEMRELTDSDIDFIVSYWGNSHKDYLVGMGVDLNKLPSGEELSKMLATQIQLPDSEKASLALIAMIDGKPAGHCNVNYITYGKEATMHLHLWEAGNRRSGMGTKMVLKSLPIFFERLKLETIWCEPYSENKAPIRTLEKVGFEFVKEYLTIPGSLNFEQVVSRWKMTKGRFEAVQNVRNPYS